MRLTDICHIKTDFAEADFWIIRRGSLSQVGKPVRDFSKYHFGIKVIREDLLIPDFLFYCFVDLHQSGEFEALAKGTLKLQHITLEDIDRRLNFL